MSWMKAVRKVSFVCSSTLSEKEHVGCLVIHWRMPGASMVKCVCGYTMKKVRKAGVVAFQIREVEWRGLSVERGTQFALHT